MGLGGKVVKPEANLALSVTGKSVKAFVDSVVNSDPLSGDPRLSKYKVPHTVNVADKLNVGKDFSNAQPKESFMVVEARRKKDMPPMNKYQNVNKWKWSKMNEGNRFQKFTKTKHKTYIGQIFHDAKQEKKPGPTTYQPNKFYKYYDSQSLSRMPVSKTA